MNLELYCNEYAEYDYGLGFDTTDSVGKDPSQTVGWGKLTIPNLVTSPPVLIPLPEVETVNSHPAVAKTPLDSNSYCTDTEEVFQVENNVNGRPKGARRAHSARVIEPYTKTERAVLIAKYLSKRKSRTYTVRCIYTSRQKYAKNRPRVGGKFISHAQAQLLSAVKKKQHLNKTNLF